MRSRSHYTDLTYMGGTGPCRTLRIIFGSIIKSWYTSLNIKFGANRNFNVPKIPVYRFVLYAIYQILWTNIAHFQYRYPMANRSLFAKFEVRRFLRSNAIVITTDVLEQNQNFALINCLQGTQGLRSIFLAVTHVLTKLIYPL